MQRRFPSAREEKAVERGAVELMVLAEWHFRKNPRVLRLIRKAYARFCLWLYAKIECNYRQHQTRGSRDV
jgi:hypothetical protein